MKGRLYRWTLRRLNAQPATECGVCCEHGYLPDSPEDDYPPDPRLEMSCLLGGYKHDYRDVSPGYHVCRDCNGNAFSTVAPPFVTHTAS
jgi:hypothetical protein